MKNIIGQPARGEDFFPRIREVERIINSLDNGNHIQITAPRRVGKTSILWYLLDNDIAERYYVYIDTESISDEQQFYKKILIEILRNEHVAGSKKLMQRLGKGANIFFRKIKSIQALGNRIEFNHEEKEQNYYEELLNFLLGYASTGETELVILIDEFPQTIENIRNINEDNARLFLQNKRSLRLTPEFEGRVKFIYTGSIGLNYTVAKLNATATINDLNSIEVGPLTYDEAIKLFHELLSAKGRTAVPAATEHLLKIIQWYIPFHIQLIVQELLQQAPDTEITPGTIDTAINNIINLRNQNHFDHYYSRLKAQFKDEAYKYADELLKRIAEENSLTKIQTLDLSAKYGLMDSYRKIIETLMYDGYIQLDETNKEYIFNSPIVKLWWLKFIC